MPYSRRTILIQSTAALTSLPTVLSALAHGTPDAEPGKLVYGFAAGGIANAIGDPLLEHLRKAHVADLQFQYILGNGSRAAQEFIKQAPPDGNSLLLLSSTSLTLFSHIYKRLNYEVKDFTPIAPLYAFTRILAVGPRVPATVKTVDDYVRWVQANPTQSNVGVSAVGSGSHFALMLLAQSRDIVLRPVAYRGSGGSLKDLLSGNLPAAIVVAGQSNESFQSGQLRALAVTSSSRWPSLPNIPTMMEQGVPDCDLVEWHGLVGPAGMDPAKVEALSQGVRAAMKEPNITEVGKQLGLQLLDMGPAEFKAFIAKDDEQWRRAVAKTRFTGME